MMKLDIERALWQQGHQHVAGVDEAGRGCLAGPVVAAAVVIAPETVIDGVNDSKKLKAPQREAVAAAIKEQAVAWGVGRCSPEEIDELNILHAAMEAMRRAVAALAVPASYLLVDGNRCFDDPPCSADTLVKGDARCHAIAAASIVAKTERDRLMHALHDEYPAYGWNTNVGYPTKAHYQALRAHGPTTHHRRSFRLS